MCFLRYIKLKEIAKEHDMLQRSMHVCDRDHDSTQTSGMEILPSLKSLKTEKEKL